MLRLLSSTFCDYVWGGQTAGYVLAVLRGVWRACRHALYVCTRVCRLQAAVQLSCFALWASECCAAQREREQLSCNSVGCTFKRPALLWFMDACSGQPCGCAAMCHGAVISSMCAAVCSDSQRALPHAAALHPSHFVPCDAQAACMLALAYGCAGCISVLLLQKVGHTR